MFCPNLPLKEIWNWLEWQKKHGLFTRDANTKVLLFMCLIKCPVAFRLWITKWCQQLWVNQRAAFKSHVHQWTIDLELRFIVFANGQPWQIRGSYSGEKYLNWVHDALPSIWNAFVLDISRFKTISQVSQRQTPVEKPLLLGVTLLKSGHPLSICMILA